MSQIEEPKFEVVKDFGSFAVRRYAGRIVAETEVTGDLSSAGNEGFRRIARYIFGTNKSKAKIAMTAPVAMEKLAGERIAMTAPVAQESLGEGKWVIAFTMPASYTIDSLPQPLDASVHLRVKPPSTWAAITFSGFNSEKLVAQKTNELREAATRQGLILTNNVSYARYNPPWTPWFLRRNEILIEVGT